jgi:hypothetical protein
VREKYRDPSLTEMRTLRTVPLSVLPVPAGLWQDATSAEPEDGIDGNPVAQRSNYLAFRQAWFAYFKNADGGTAAAEHYKNQGTRPAAEPGRGKGAEACAEICWTPAMDAS